MIYKNKGVTIDPYTVNDADNPRGYWYSDDKENFDLRNVDFDQGSPLKTNESWCSRLNTPHIVYPYTEFFSPTKKTKASLNDAFYSVRLMKIMDMSARDPLTLNVTATVQNANGVKINASLQLQELGSIDLGDTVLMAYERKTKNAILIYNVTRKEAYRYGCETLGNFVKT